MTSGLANNRKINEYGRVAVLMGGKSAERVISLETGRAVHRALVDRGVDAVAVDARDDVIACLAKHKFDRVFIALHGRGGEDGEIQGALEVLGLPYTGSAVLGSALAMDKIKSKLIWKQLGLHTPDFMEINCEKDIHRAIDEIGVPLMVKPVHEGSSCGASKVRTLEDIPGAWQTACQYGDEVMAESWVNGEEYTAAILGDEVLPLIRLRTPHEFYDYSAKYEVDSTEYICPCGLPSVEEENIKSIAMRAFDSLSASGWGRVDLFIDDQGVTQLIEANTVPGMTSHSLVPMAARQSGLEFGDLALKILDTSFDQRFQTAVAIA